MEASKPMNRVLFGIAIVGGAFLLGGCPIYPSTDSSAGGGGYYGEFRVCNSSGCFSCPSDTYSPACVAWSCATNADCADGYDCVYPDGASPESGTCLPQNGEGGGEAGGTSACSKPSDCASGLTCGQDGACHTGDCGGSVGCPSGYVCRLAGGQAACVATTGAPADAGAAQDAAPPENEEGGLATGSDAAQPPPAGSDASSSPPADAAPVSTADASRGAPCNADSACAGAGARCVDGFCTARAGLCSDTTQCTVRGEACVDGLCEPHCNAASPCPTGYSCDLTRGVCNVNPGACTTTANCLGGTVCVEQHCVPPCSADDAGTACADGQVCVNGGCIPDQAATFGCTNDGENGQLANLCGPTSICLHHDCYTACGGETGACTDPSAATCKSVTIETGTYEVCGLATNLGSECDPAQGKACTEGLVCVDGYCK